MIGITEKVKKWKLPRKSHLHEALLSTYPSVQRSALLDEAAFEEL